MKPLYCVRIAFQLTEPYTLTNLLVTLEHGPETEIAALLNAALGLI